LIYTHGGLVRDFLLGGDPKDVDIEFSCPPSVIYSTCVKNFGESKCFLRDMYFQMPSNDPNSAYEPLEGVNWRGTIFGPAFGKEFTTNALSYDMNGNDVIIDIIGSGTMDTCKKNIVIPVHEDMWELWTEEQNGIMFNGYKKLPRFWKLRAVHQETLARSNHPCFKIF
jgi:tRNA nucleotidyltransferase/poly(A) polymerase